MSLVSCYAAGTSSATILLAGFTDFDSSTLNEASDSAYTAPGFSGVVNKNGSPSQDARGSTSGTFGDSSIPAPTGDGYLRMGTSGLGFSVTNSTGSSVPLVAFLFDAASASGSSTFSVSYNFVGSTDPDIVLGSETASAVSGPSNSAAPYGGFSFNLPGVMLDSLSTIVFTFTSTSSDIRIDNVGLLAIPEPSSMLALGCLVGSGVFLRSRSRRVVAA